MIDKLVLALVVIGALNWGSIGIFQYDLVAALFGGQAAIISRIVYTLVALAGRMLLFSFVNFYIILFAMGLLTTITEWKKTVHAPNVVFTDEQWAPFVEMAEKVDRNEYFVTHYVAPGIFEQCHYLQEIQNCLINFYEEPEAMHELIDYITEWELKYAEEVCKHLHPDALFHHDDWGSQQSTFISPAMFEEFFLPAYKKVYGYYKDHGVELIVHHSDSYAATLVPYMIEMGIDIWQGVMNTNNIPELIKQYGGKITFMGGVDSATVDRPDWTREMVAEQVRKACESCGTKFYIPNTSQGGAMSTYPGVYEAVSEEIDKMSKELFR